jgi:hypothetical protein
MQWFNMILISHRGNISGINKKSENNPDRILEVLSLGYNVEIDVWVVKGDLFLGHDSPQYKIDLPFLSDVRLWCHAKNIDALETMLNANNIHCFWHQNDDYTLTSRGYIWTYPNQKLSNISIAVLPETVKNYDISNAFGICSDIIKAYSR